MKTITIFFVCFFAALALACDGFAASARPKIPATGKTIEEFVPAGWTILQNAEGDLNGDGSSDAAIILAPETEEEAGPDQELPKRLLVILFRAPDGRYKLSATSDKAVLCKECGGVFGDPLSKIGIERGAVVIEHYAGSRERWGYTHRFRYQNGAWYLIGETAFVQDGLDRAAASVDTNFVTGRSEMKKTSCKGKETTEKMKNTPKPLTPLSSFDIEEATTPQLPECK